ncbi:MAG: hypothetical protein ACREON_02340 [Gemmatimonadaceae bacterium]
MRYAALAASLLALFPVGISAQAVLDQGSFSIYRGETRVGREEFTIRREAGAGGGTIVAYATLTYDGQRITPALRTADNGRPVAYQVEVAEGNEVTERLRGEIGMGRFSGRVRTPRGESGKEYVVSDGALVLDDDVFHQYYFLAHGGGERSGSVPVVIPRRNVQVSMRVESLGADQVTVGGVALDARHLVLRGPGGEARHVWVDAQGRLLKVTLEQRGLVAIRDRPPG